jgi:hypothetical protein
VADERSRLGLAPFQESASVILCSLGLMIFFKRALA